MDLVTQMALKDGAKDNVGAFDGTGETDGASNIDGTNEDKNVALNPLLFTVGTADFSDGIDDTVLSYIALNVGSGDSD